MQQRKSKYVSIYSVLGRESLVLGPWGGGVGGVVDVVMLGLILQNFFFPLSLTSVAELCATRR